MSSQYEEHQYHEIQKLEFEVQDLEERLSDRDEKIEELQAELAKFNKLKPLLPFLVNELKDFIHYQKHPALKNEEIQKVIYRTMSHNITDALDSLEAAL